MGSINWHNVAGIIAAVVTVTIAIGGIMLALMRGFFMTTKSCQLTQANCQQKVCKKIDELKTEVKENRELVGVHYAEIQGSLGRIEGRLNVGGREQ